MINRIVNSVIDKLNITTEEYKNSIYKRVDMFLEYSQLPEYCMLRGLDVSRLPIGLKSIYASTQDIIDSKFDNTIINTDTFVDTGHISALLMEKYVVDSLIADKHISSMLYIDTNLLIDDYKKLINSKDGHLSPSTIHSLDVLYKEIYEADYVFWDKFSMVSGGFATNKLYEILSIRQRRCLGNMYFVTGGIIDYFATQNFEFLGVMRAQIQRDLRLEKFKHIGEN
jgi:hypothetical protein